MSRNRWLPRLLPALVFAAACLAFLPALRQGFVELDDDLNFTQNPHILSFSPENLRWMLESSHVGHWQPLSWLSIALDVQLWGGVDPRGLHATNLLLHALDALLVYFLAQRLLKLGLQPAGVGESSELSPTTLRLAAAAAALFWGLHPLRVESVAWATERRDVLSTAFLLLAVLAYLRMAAAQRRGWAWLALALVAYAASLLSKAWGITLPALLLVLDVWPLRRVRRAGLPRIALEKIAFLALALIAAWRAAAAQEEAFAVVSLEEHGIAARLAQASYGLAFYVVKTIWPAQLSAMYLLERDFDPARGIYLASAAFVILTTLTLVLLRRRWPAGLTAWVAYAILVSPVLGLLQSGAQKVADRYTYLAAIPFALLFGAGLAVSGRKLAARPRAPRGWAAVLAAASVPLLAALGVASWRQTRVWRDSETLFRRVVEVEPDNYLGHHNLSIVLRRAGKLDPALEHARLSVEAHPAKGNVDARLNLGQLERMRGREDEALAEFARALEIEPAHAGTLAQMESWHLGRGDPAGAIALYERAIQAEPRSIDGYRRLAELYAAHGRAGEVIPLWQRAAAAAPDSHLARSWLGVALFQAGRPAEAAVELAAAVQLAPGDAQAQTNLGCALWQLGRGEEAIERWRLALRIDPSQAEARRFLEQAGRAVPPP
jgi:tetratricopeptide (TPR) repeat protein